MPEQAWSVVVDRDVCMGSGVCILYAPGTFVHDAEAKATVIDPARDAFDAVRTAVEACPTGALRLVIAGEGERAS